MKGLVKNFWIEGIELFELNGERNIPTQITYQEKEILIGNLLKPNLGEKIVSQNFKINLGEYVIGESNYKVFDTNIGSKSAMEISKDYISKLLSAFEYSRNIDKNSKEKIKITIAEPISFQSGSEDEKWLKNYRKNIKRILSDYGEVDFLPEPFAVYQYYKYGLKIPLLQDKAKNIVLIIDFGGGTFDVSIIETTNQGEISQSGKHSRPLASRSRAFGGFKVNAVIAEYLILRGLDNKSDKQKGNEYIKLYYRIQKGENSLYRTLNEEKRKFIDTFEKLITIVETAKIELCNIIKDWGLDAECYEHVFINIPQNPFEQNTEWQKKQFFGHELKNIFINKIWPNELKPTIQETIKQAKDSISNKKIDIVLISGGSSNIRWLDRIINTDKITELCDLTPIPLNESFQEIVAKGLAIECARRFYEKNSEFVSVAYNPIRLFLKPDNQDSFEKNLRFTSVENKVEIKDHSNNVIISSAQALANFIDVPLQWKFRLSRPPKNKLDYYFSKLELDDLNDVDFFKNIYNIDHTVSTPSNASFEASLRLELQISADGTAKPKFIYHTANLKNSIPECSVEGKPFVIDMTYEDSRKINASYYLGLDFGSSNSSLCSLTNNEIHEIEQRNNDKKWMELKDLLVVLPYPLSFPLRKYISTIDRDKAAENARDAFEAMLAFAAYTSLAEVSSLRIDMKSLVNNFQHRSMGPLKALLENSLRLLGKNAFFSKGYNKLFENHRDLLTKSINEFNDHKHKKINSQDFNPHEILLVMANICRESLIDCSFVYSESSETISRNKNRTIFRLATDNQPFVDFFEYEDSKAFPNNEIYLLNEKAQLCLQLTPLFFIFDDHHMQHTKRFCILDKITELNCNEKDYIAKYIDSDKCNSYRNISEDYHKLIADLMTNFSNAAIEMLTINKNLIKKPNTYIP